MKTAEINRKSLNCLKNIYNLNCELKGKNLIADEAEFISKIYEYSEKNLTDEEKSFFVCYFGMIIAVFNYFKNDPQGENIKDILEAKGNFEASDNKYTVAKVLYIYYFYDNNKCSALEREQMEKYIYILQNLNISAWGGEFLKSIDSFVDAIAKNEDVFEYFSNTDLIDIQNACKGELEDIKIRIREQKIKAGIIKTEGLAWNYFNELEVQSKERKIQYLFYLSGYWSNSGDYGKLLDYIKIAKIYFKSYDNDLKWRKIFAIAGCLDSANTLKSAEDINKDCGRRHIWNDSFYFWNDEDDKNLSLKNKELEVIKVAYKNKSKIDGLINSLPSDMNYDNCWLKYAIKYNFKDLIDTELIWDANDNIARMKSYPFYRYDIYIMHIVGEKKYGLKNLGRMAEVSYVFNNNRSYTHSNGTMSFIIGDRRFIMRLCTSIIITKINENYDEKLCLYSYDLTNNIYRIYIVDSPYKFMDIKYDLNTEIHKQNIEYNNQLAMLNKHNMDDYLEIKEGKKLGWRLKANSRSSWENETIKISFNGNLSSSYINL